MTRKGWFGTRIGAAVVAAVVVAVHSAGAQIVVSSETFDHEGTPWTANGVETLVNDGRGISGQYLQLPFLDFFGAHLRTEDPRSGLLGDLTRYHQGLTITYDMATFAFQDFDGNNIDPASRPVIMQLFDRGDPNDFEDDVSVWVETRHIPSVEEGWVRFTFTIPDPSSVTLPEGWGGTGAEDPVTFEPILPPGRTYTSVLRSVDEVQFTTFKPGYFYGFAFWEIGWDNITVTRPGSACACDFSGDASLTVQDIFDFLSAYFSNAPSADFNGDMSITVQDIFDFLSCYFTGC